MATFIGNRRSDFRGRDDTDRGNFSLFVLTGTIALAGAGMAIAIVIGASPVKVGTLFASFWR